MQINVTTIKPEQPLTSFISWLEYIERTRLHLTQTLYSPKDEDTDN